MKLLSIKGNEINMGLEEKEYLSVLSAGYIITNEGLCIKINDEDDHSNIFTKFINKYNDIEYEKWMYYETTEAILPLLNYGNVIYIGIKMKDTQRYNSKGYGILAIPTNITKSQKECIDTLLQSNKSIFSGSEILELTLATNEDNKLVEKDMTYLNEILNSTQKNRE